MHVFNGTDPLSWVYREKLFFSINRLSEPEKLVIVGVSFDEIARHWFRWMDKLTPSGVGLISANFQDDY